MLKKIVLLALLFAPIAIFAQEKIAYLNSQEIMYKMPEIKDIESKLATKAEAIKKSLEAIQSEFEKKSNDFQANLEKFQSKDPAITEIQLKEAQEELVGLESKWQTYNQTSQAEYEKYQRELLTPIQEKVANAIKAVGDEQKYTYIIDAPALLYVGTSAIDAGKIVKTKLGIKD